MKIKSIISLAAMALGVFAFQACEDVPAPYEIPSTGGASIYGTGLADDPYSVDGAMLNQNGGHAWTKAYIVGYVPLSSDDNSYYTLSDAVFSTQGAATSNIVIAASPDEKDFNNCMAVQLPSGDVRSALNLADHPENLGKEVKLYGTMESYYGGAGIKNVSAALLDGQEIGTMPTEEGDALFSANFATSLDGFTSVSASGNLSWYNDFSSAMATGYQDFDGDGQKENQAGVTYFVSPAIDLSNVSEAYVAVNMAINYERGDINTNNALLISKNYAGDVNTATWTQLPYDTEGLGSSFTFVEKEAAIPSEFLGDNVTIALRHTCNDSQSSTWEVKTLRVLEGQPTVTPQEPEPPATGEFLSQDFSNSLGDFTSVAAAGSLSWYNDYSSAMVTGYQDFDGDGQKENQAGVTYFVSPAFDIDNTTAAYMAINMAINYERGDINTNNAVLISKDYTGDVNTATWTQLPYDTEGLGSSFTFAEKNIVIPTEFIGSNVVVALRHTCNDSQSSTWEVKSIKVLAGTPEETIDPEPEPTPGTDGDATISISDNVVTITNTSATESAAVTTTQLSSFGWDYQEAPDGGSDSEGTTFVFAQEEGRNAPLYYTNSNGVRMYALNSLTLQANRPIAKVTLTCETSSHVGNEQMYVTISGNTWTLVNDFTSNSGGTQLRIQTIEITYAE